MKIIEKLKCSVLVLEPKFENMEFFKFNFGEHADITADKYF